MKHLFIIDAPDTFNPHKDTSTLLMDEARSRGHEVTIGHIFQLGVNGGEVFCSNNKVSDFDVVWVRKDPPIDQAYIEHLQILSLLRGKVFFVNDPLSVLELNEKLAIFNFNHLIADTIVTQDHERIGAFLEKHEVAVLKPLNSFSGNGVMKIRKGEKVEFEGFVMVQEFLENVTDGDIRVHVVDGEVIGALRRVPKSGEFRANLHAGGKAVKAELSDKELSVASEVALFLKSKGIFFAGIDLIDGRLNEINVTSPGIIIETNEVSDEKLEVKMFDKLCSILN